MDFRLDVMFFFRVGVFSHSVKLDWCTVPFPHSPSHLWETVGFSLTEVGQPDISETCLFSTHMSAFPLSELSSVFYVTQKKRSHHHVYEMIPCNKNRDFPTHSFHSQSSPPPLLWWQRWLVLHMCSWGLLKLFWNHDVLNCAHNTFHLNSVTMYLGFQHPIRNQRHLCLVSIHTIMTNITYWSKEINYNIFQQRPTLQNLVKHGDFSKPTRLHKLI